MGREDSIDCRPIGKSQEDDWGKRLRGGDAPLKDWSITLLSKASGLERRISAAKRRSDQDW